MVDNVADTCQFIYSLCVLINSPAHDMLRDRHPCAPEQFSTSELAAGSGLSARNIMFLCSQELIPVVSGGFGRGQHREFDYQGLARAALVSAFFDAGIEIYSAAKLVSAIRKRETLGLDYLPNLHSYISDHPEQISNLAYEGKIDLTSPYYLHYWLRANSNKYEIHTARVYDQLMEIYDRQFVFSGNLVPGDGPGELALGGLPTARFRIVGWKRGQGGVEIERVPPGKSLEELPQGWRSAPHNFRGMVRINASIAIRDALDQVFALRA